MIMKMPRVWQNSLHQLTCINKNHVSNSHTVTYWTVKHTPHNIYIHNQYTEYQHLPSCHKFLLLLLYIWTLSTVSMCTITSENSKIYLLPQYWITTGKIAHTSISKHILMCMNDYRQGLDWRLDLLTTSTHTTINYSTIADLHTLQITTAHTKPFQYAVSSPVVPW
jgi:hypothetical protein